MAFQTMALISIFYAIIGIRVVVQIVRRRRAMFDLNFTDEDRRLVTEAAFFILLPISVALHELGHAVAVWSFGGEVTGFGYYVFAGYVSHQGFYTPDQQILIALAGPGVSTILSVIALTFVVLHRPPMRAAFNELLIQFAALSAINALIFYPLLDFATGLNGDWHQIYFGGDPTLSRIILVGHVGILTGSFVALRTAPVRRYLASLTGMPEGTERGLFGNISAIGGRSGSAPRHLSPSALAIQEAVKRAASGWPAPAQAAIHEQNGLVLGLLNWASQGVRRTVAIRALPDGPVELWGMIQAEHQPESDVAARRQIQHWPQLPSTDTLTLDLRLALEQVESWSAAGATTSS
ncbi:MAG TPA: site-2 protease family protein [Thermomicrobiales bacterium]|nr:site-2 protease family protein [Thermomicrobiales bacterium]